MWWYIKTGGGQIYLNFMTVLWYPRNVTNTKGGDLLEWKYSTGRMPLFASNHSFQTCGADTVLASTTIQN